MIFKDIQMSQLHSFKKEEMDPWCALWGINIFVWLASVIFNVWFYFQPDCVGLYLLLNKVFSGMLFIALGSFVCTCVIEQEVSNYARFDDYEELPVEGKKIVFLYMIYSALWIFNTPMVVIMLPILVLKVLFYDIPNKVLDGLFAEKPNKSDILNDYNTLLKKKNGRR